MSTGGIFDQDRRLSTRLISPRRRPDLLLALDVVTDALRGQTKVQFAIWAALLLTASSFVTTFIGIANFHFHWTVAFITALGVQLLVYISAWIFAEARAARMFLRRIANEAEPDSQIYRSAKTKAEGAGYFVGGLLLVFSISVSIFFSFDALFDAVYKPEQQLLTNMKVARSDIGSVFGELNERVEAERARIMKSLLASPGWATWRKNVDKILRTAEDARKTIADAVLREQSEAKLNLEQTQKDLKTKEELLNTLSGQIKLLESGGGSVPTAAPVSTDEDASRIQDLQKQRQDLQTEIDSLQKRADDYTAKMAEEDKSGGKNADGSRRNQGKGPVYRSLERERLAVQAQLDARKQQIGALNGRIRQVEDRIAKSNLSQVEAQQKALTAKGDLKTKLDAATREVEQARIVEATARARFERTYGRSAAPAGEGTAAEPAQAADATLNTLDSMQMVGQARKAIDSFASNGTRTSYDDMMARCERILGLLAEDARMRSLVGDAGCESSELASAVARLSTLETATKDLEQRCRVDEAFNAMTTVKQMVDKARTCVGLSQLSYDDAKSQRDRIDTVEQENSPSTSHFERSLATLWRGDKLAWLAVFIAFFVDFGVFASAVMGASALESALHGDGRVASSADLHAVDLSQFVTSTIHDDDPPSIRNQKTLLANLTVDETEGRSRFVYDVKHEGERTDQVIRLNTYVARGLASGIPGRPGVFVVHDSFVQHVAESVGEYERDRQIRLMRSSGRQRFEEGPRAPMDFRTPDEGRPRRGRWQADRMAKVLGDPTQDASGDKRRIAGAGTSGRREKRDEASTSDDA